MVYCVLDTTARQTIAMYQVPEWSFGNRIGEISCLVSAECESENRQTKTHKTQKKEGAVMRIVPENTIRSSVNFSLEEFADIIGYDPEQVEAWCFMSGDHLPYEKHNGSMMINSAEGMLWIFSNGIEVKGVD